MNKQKINEQYIKEFNNGKSIWEIVFDNDSTYKKVFESITGRSFSYKLLPKEEKEYIVRLYKNKLSTPNIGKIYGVGNKPIALVLEEYGIKRDQKRFARKYHLNENYFDIIDTPNKAYCLGFLAADGCNFTKKSTISMSLEEDDKEILEKMRTEMGNEHPLEYLDYSNKHDFGYTYKNQYRMLIFSTHMCNSLCKVGIVPAKSYCLEFPEFLDDDLLPHYIRGIMDGD